MPFVRSAIACGTATRCTMIMLINMRMFYSYMRGTTNN